MTESAPIGFFRRGSPRGRNYTRLRGFVEAALRVAYRGDWPAAVYGLFPRSRQIRRVHMELPLLRHGPRVRLGFVSDVHLGPTTALHTAREAFALLAAAELDVLLLGGDYVFLEATPARAACLQELVASVPARHKLAVMGNHDLWTDHGILEGALAAAGATVLVNESVQCAGITVVGLDDPWTGRRDPEIPFRPVPGTTSAATIVLCHAPEALPWVAHQPVDLYLCGHTHGGHVAMPWGPVVVPGHVGRMYHAGFYPEALGKRLFVSRGVGGIELPLRTYAPPDVLVLDLVPIS
ncbi:MAG: metallophosphoesterase [Polyangiaceae bacterium]|nr:metallophosphoesterase [Polyangiaceae bacterium]